eukprot:UN00221
MPSVVAVDEHRSRHALEGMRPMLRCGRGVLRLLHSCTHPRVLCNPGNLKRNTTQ